MYKDFSKIYDELMKGQVDYNLLASDILNICKENNLKVNNILECAMGSGVLTEKFLKRNFHVDGFDISDDMLSLAYNRLLDYKNVNIYKGDIRTFSTGKKYDLICCFFDVLNYLKNLDEIEKFLNNIYEQMKENSIFMFDLNSEYKLKEYLGNNTFVIEEKDIFYTWRNSIFKNQINFNIDFFVKENNLYRRITENQIQYIHSEAKIDELILKNNFIIIKKLDFEDFNNLHNNSFRILYVLKKLKIN